MDPKASMNPRALHAYKDSQVHTRPSWTSVYRNISINNSDKHKIKI